MAELSEYRRDIDGLRAVAVLSVLAFHTFPSKVPGGFVGVDVFFVLSGFLISGIVFRSLEAGSFSYRSFYVRRIRRIFPALLTVAVACLLVGYPILFTTEFIGMAANMAAAAGFAANVALWHEAGYFDTDSAVKPLLHLWSLGVEEQFYIAWPLVAGWLVRASRRVSLLLLANLCTASFAANLWLTTHEPAAAFYLPFPRFWELTAGALLAYTACARPREGGRPLLRSLAAGVGLGLILGSVMLTSPAGFPGLQVLPPTLGTLLVLAAGPGGWVNRNLLSRRVPVFIGLISYPLYLWHWPVLTFLRIAEGDDLGWMIKVAALVVSVSLASATFQLIEQPLRFSARGPAKAAGLAAAMTSVGLFAWIASATMTPWPGRDSFVAYFDNTRPDYRYGRAHGLFASMREECNFLDIATERPRQQIAASCTTPNAPRSLFLWGDSHAQHLAAGLKATLPATVSLLQVATSACRLSLEPAADQTIACQRSNAFALREILRVKPDVVVLAERVFHLATDWDRFAAELHARGVRSVVLVGPVAQWSRGLPTLVARDYWPSRPEYVGRNILERTRIADAELRKRYGSSPELTFVSLLVPMCSPAGCRAYVGPDTFDDIVSFDYGHLTPAASRYVAAHVLAPELRAIFGSE